MKRWFAIGAVGMVMLYAALAIGAADCLFMQPAAPDHAQHSPSHATHSPLCAWACQGNPAETIPTAIPLIFGVVFVAMQPSVSAAPQVLLISTVSRSRAPPV
jgi:hypothetical protein